MAQISLYVDEALLKKIEHALQEKINHYRNGLQIKSKIDPVYPMDYENLFGSVADSSFARPEGLSYKNDTTRETL